MYCIVAGKAKISQRQATNNNVFVMNTCRCAVTDKGCTSDSNCHHADAIESLANQKVEELRRWQQKTRLEVNINLMLSSF